MSSSQLAQMIFILRLKDMGTSFWQTYPLSSISWRAARTASCGIWSRAEVAVSGKEYVGVCVFVFGGCLVNVVQHDEVGHVFFGAGVGGLYDGAGGFPDFGEFLLYECLGEVTEDQDIREVEAGFQIFAPGGYLGPDPV